MPKWRPIQPPSSPQQLTLKYGNSRDRFSDRLIHRPIEDRASVTRIPVHNIGNGRQKTKKAKGPRKAGIHPASLPASQRFTSCSSNYSNPGATPTKASEEACIRDILCTRRPSSQGTGSNSFIRFGPHAVWAKSSPTHGSRTAAHRIPWRLRGACRRGCKAPCNLWGKGGHIRAVTSLSGDVENRLLGQTSLIGGGKAQGHLCRDGALKYACRAATGVG